MSLNFIETPEGITIDINDQTRYKVPFEHDSNKVVWDNFRLVNDIDGEDHFGYLCKYSLDELPKPFECTIKLKDYEITNSQELIIRVGQNNNYSLELNISFAGLEWNKPYSIRKYCNLLESKLIDDLESVANYLDETFEFYTEYDLSKRDIKKPLQVIVDDYLSVIENAFKITFKQLEDFESKNVFIKYFNFPSKYQNIYTQYLIWFGEFLSNLNIKSEVSTEQKNGQVALIVSPKDAPELLDEIEKQFYLYLQLPYVEVLPPQKEMSIQEQHTFMAVRQQIQMLEMQVEAKDSLLLNHNSTIASLNTSIARQADLIETQADKLTLVNALVDKDKWTKVPFTEGTFKCKNFGKKTMSIQFEPLAVFNKLANKKDESSKEGE